MANHGCINGAIDDARYSSPVPVIGLYIASASLLCMLMMLCDIITGFRARKRWLPCKFFTLNSVTLTLLSVAAKLPVDLTTPMPSPSDQLSKLSGSTFICVSLCFLMPSLGDNPESETFTNMVSLTIFVITLLVNISIQLFTGVIAVFFIEHIVIMSFMLILIMTMWYYYWEISNTKKVDIATNREIFRKGDGSLLQRLKSSYLFGYRMNTQFVACLDNMGVVSGVVCFLCSATLLQAAYRSLILKQKQLKFCSGNSDYQWSMPAIVFTQILTVFVGNFAVTFRWLSMSKYMSFEEFFVFVDKEADDVINANPVLGTVSRLEKYGRVLRYAFLTTIEWLQQFIRYIPAFTIFRFLAYMEWDVGWASWTRRKSDEDMEVWIDQSKSEISNLLSQVLSRNYPYQQFGTMEVTDPSHPNINGVCVSALSIVLLVRIAQVSLPEDHSRSLVQTFSETNEIFHFIDKRINPKSFKYDHKLMLAKSVWAGQDFNCLLPKIFNTTTNPIPQSALPRALSIITDLKSILPSDPVWKELGIIVDFIKRKRYTSIEELVTSVEKMFADMVSIMLAQLPHAIFRSLSDSTDEEYEENMKLALKLVCKVESVEEHVRWSFPAGYNFTSLATDDDFSDSFF